MDTGTLKTNFFLSLISCIEIKYLIAQRYLNLIVDKK